MSETDLDALAEAARNRGLKLVRSRVRTPGKRGFEKAGLADATGKPVFGLDDKGSTETPEAVEEYLRGLGTSDWGASLGTTKTRSRAASPKPQAAKPRQVAPPKPSVREARPGDAPRLVELITELGYEIDEKAVRKNLAALKQTGETPLVAMLGRELVGMCGVGRRVVVHRPAPLGRITALIVTKSAQRHGIGRMLVEAAEAWMGQTGCQLVEVTSNDRRAEAHAFYRHLGYERTSLRFAKSL